ncbi:8-oxo-dGTP diphosphatase [Candidatus Gracilibacteria bacterium]|nr:8-oxo-dGTP diphosphatase [Candidatus Gracilibacteria bacterium]
MKLATLCYLKKDGKTLMLHRVKKENDTHEGKWNGVGGKFEAGETPEECAIREIGEETGLVARDPILKGILTFPNFAKGEDWYVYVYEVYDFSGELIDSDEGNLEWIDDDQILSLNLWDGDKHFMQWMQEGRFFSGKFVYVDKKLVSYEGVFH